MEIKTKYNIGDEIWYLDTDNKPFPKAIKVSINKVLALFDNSTCYIYYNGWETENWEHIPEKLKEDRVFKTKEELLKSL